MSLLNHESNSYEDNVPNIYSNNNPQKIILLPFYIKKNSTLEDPSYPLSNLEKTNMNNGGWLSKKFCSYPQKIIVKFNNYVNIKQINIIINENKIPTKIEFINCIELNDNSNNNEDKYKYENIGYLNFSSNADNNYKLRQSKNMKINVYNTNRIKLFLYENHKNSFNEFNQIGIISLEFYGNIADNIKKINNNQINNDNKNEREEEEYEEEEEMEEGEEEEDEEYEEKVENEEKKEKSTENEKIEEIKIKENEKMKGISVEGEEEEEEGEEEEEEEEKEELKKNEEKEKSNVKIIEEEKKEEKERIKENNEIKNNINSKEMNKIEKKKITMIKINKNQENEYINKSPNIDDNNAKKNSLNIESNKTKKDNLNIDSINNKKDNKIIKEMKNKLTIKNLNNYNSNKIIKSANFKFIGKPMKIAKIDNNNIFEDKIEIIKKILKENEKDKQNKENIHFKSLQNQINELKTILNKIFNEKEKTQKENINEQIKLNEEKRYINYLKLNTMNNNKLLSPNQIQKKALSPLITKNNSKITSEQEKVPNFNYLSYDNLPLLNVKKKQNNYNSENENNSNFDSLNESIDQESIEDNYLGELPLEIKEKNKALILLLGGEIFQKLFSQNLNKQKEALSILNQKVNDIIIYIPENLEDANIYIISLINLIIMFLDDKHPIIVMKCFELFINILKAIEEKSNLNNIEYNFKISKQIIVKIKEKFNHASKRIRQKAYELYYYMLESNICNFYWLLSELIEDETKEYY